MKHTCPVLRSCDDHIMCFIWRLSCVNVMNWFRQTSFIPAAHVWKIKNTHDLRLMRHSFIRARERERDCSLGLLIVWLRTEMLCSVHLDLTSVCWELEVIQSSQTFIITPLNNVTAPRNCERTRQTNQDKLQLCFISEGGKSIFTQSNKDEHSHRVLLN